MEIHKYISKIRTKHAKIQNKTKICLSVLERTSVNNSDKILFQIGSYYNEVMR